MKRILLGLLLSAISLCTSAQEEVDAKTLFKYGAFDAALIKYQDLYSQDPTDVEVNYRIGFCYLMTNYDKAAAIPFFEFALENGKKGEEPIVELGQAYMYAHRFDDAIAKFNQYKNLVGKKPDLINIADKYISFCQNAKELTANPVPVTITNMGDRINSAQSDFFPAINREENKLLFSTDRRYISQFAEFIHDVNITEYKYGRWKRPRSVGSKINSTDHEYLVGATPTLDVLVIRPRTYESDGDLFLVEITANEKSYQAPIKLPEPINYEKSFESSGCLSPSGDTLYFSSDREGGLGGSDIYFSLKIGENWGIPQNLGPTINTPYNDEYPRVSFDGKTLMFASEGHKSMGGYDIFLSEINPKTREWGKPGNIGYPINTTYDDYNIALAEGGRYGYIAQVQKDGFGQYDIYKVVFNEEEPIYVTYTGVVAVGDTVNYTIVPELGLEPQMQVKNADTEELFGEYAINKKTGRYVIALPPGNYEFSVNVPGYKPFVEKIIIDEMIPSSRYRKLDVFFSNTPPVEEKSTNSKK